MQHAIQRLFDASKNLEDGAFCDFVKALCRLSAAMVGMQSDTVEPVNESTEELTMLSPSSTLSLSAEPAHRRRVSGIHLPRTLVSVKPNCNRPVLLTTCVRSAQAILELAS